MNFYEYLQSRFVTSQIALNKKQTTTGHAENHAILALMWVGLKAATVFHLVLILFHYFGVLFHLISAPQAAKEIVAAARVADTQAKLEAEKFAKETMANVLKDRADAGLDLAPKKGTA